MTTLSTSKVLLSLFNFLGILVAFTIPFNLLLNSYMIVLFAFLFVINIACKNVSYKKGSFPLVALLISFYLLEIISLFYTENIQVGIFILQKKAGLLVFPLLIAFINEINIRSIFKGFVLGCVTACMICLFSSVNSFLATRDISVFFNENLASGIGIHHVYFSLHLCFALLIILSNTSDLFSFSLVKRIGVVGAAFLLFLCIVLLSARTLLITITAILFYKIFFVFLKKKSILIKISVLIILLSGTFLVVFLSPVLKARILDIATSKLYFNPEENNANGLTLRIVKWQCSLEGISQHFLIGLGVGDAQDFLQNCYLEKNFWGQVFQYNSHNQYLQTGLVAGVISMCLYLLVLTVPLYLSIKCKKYLYTEFLILIIMVGLTESFLERQHGVVFYSFFNSLFLFHVLKQS